MSTLSRGQASHFRTPATSLHDIDAKAAAVLITLAADIALIVDSEGVIEDLSFGSDTLSSDEYSHWLGLPWIETVAADSRDKVEALLRDAGAEAPTRGREINHQGSDGQLVPIRYSALKVGDQGKIVAIGRDLTAMAALQQQLVRAQQSMEREYAKLRHAETRYRLLFQISSEAVLIADALSQRIVDANPAAGELIGNANVRLIGDDLLELFDAADRERVRQLLAEVRFAGKAEGLRARLARTGDEQDVSASLFRQDNTAHYLVRLVPVESRAATAPRGESYLNKVIEGLPDCFVVAGPDRRILSTNQAFLDLAQVASETMARGELIDRWIGRAGVDVNVLMANLREHGSIRNFGTVVRGEFGSTEEVELSAVAALDGEEPCYGFVLRPTVRRFVADERGGEGLPQSVEQLTELVGRVPLREIVRDTTDIIERLCVEAALQMTGDNRASASQLLGLSRQSLYAKLRRYGLGDDAEDDV
jgi:transcriptional regulator PpsR